MRVYAKSGFGDVMDAIWLGRGECNAESERAEEEEAISMVLWPMIWWLKDYIRDMKI